jgi:hypothetical protein
LKAEPTAFSIPLNVASVTPALVEYPESCTTMAAPEAE